MQKCIFENDGPVRFQGIFFSQHLVLRRSAKFKWPSQALKIFPAQNISGKCCGSKADYHVIFWNFSKEVYFCGVPQLGQLGGNDPHVYRNVSLSFS